MNKAQLGTEFEVSPPDALVLGKLMLKLDDVDLTVGVQMKLEERVLGRRTVS